MHSQNCAPYMTSGRGWLAGDWPSTGGVLNITAAVWTAGFLWWRSGNKKRAQNVSEYMLVLAQCLVVISFFSGALELYRVAQKSATRTSRKEILLSIGQVNRVICAYLFHIIARSRHKFCDRPVGSMANHATLSKSLVNEGNDDWRCLTAVN